MKAKNNTLKTILAVLVIILISLISFIGVFKKDKNKMINLLPDYKLGMEFTGGRTFSLKASESNNKEDLTDENYEKAKDILIERLKVLGIKEYDVRKNSSTGEITITIPEDDYTDKIISDIYQGGDLKIVDSEEAKISSVITGKALRNIDDKLKEKNIEGYKVVISKKEEKVEATETTPESTEIKYEVNIVLPEGAEIKEEGSKILLPNGTEVKKEELELNSYNIITTEVNSDSIILSNEKINQIKDETSKANINNYSIKVKDDKVYILNSSENKVDKIAEFEVKDEILLGKKYIKDVQVAYGTQNTGTAVVVNIYYDKEGTKTLNELSKIYVAKEDEKSTEKENENTSSEQNATEENTNSEETETSKTVDLVLDGSKLISTDLGGEIKDGKLQLSMGQASSNTSELSEYLMQASNFAVILKTDTLPITYEIDTNLFTKSDITNDMLNNLLMFTLVICAVLAIYIFVKYKKSGVLAVISIIGYTATLLLVIKGISNITITITGVTAIILGIIMNAVYNISLFKSNGKNTFKKVSCRFLGMYLPCLAIAVVFAFSKYLPIASFGGILFWSLLTMVIYNLLITNLLLKNSEDK